MSTIKHSSIQFANVQDKNNIDIDTFVVGETRVVVVPPQGCCGSTICFYENLVTDVGVFKGASGQEIRVAVLENGMTITANQIQYVL